MSNITDLQGRAEDCRVLAKDTRSSLYPPDPGGVHMYDDQRVRFQIRAAALDTRAVVYDCAVAILQALDGKRG